MLPKGKQKGRGANRDERLRERTIAREETRRTLRKAYDTIKEPFANAWRQGKAIEEAAFPPVFLGRSGTLPGATIEISESRDGINGIWRVIEGANISLGFDRAAGEEWSTIEVTSVGDDAPRFVSYPSRGELVMEEATMPLWKGERWVFGECPTCPAGRNTYRILGVDGMAACPTHAVELFDVRLAVNGAQDPWAPENGLPTPFFTEEQIRAAAERLRVRETGTFTEEALRKAAEAAIPPAESTWSVSVPPVIFKIKNTTMGRDPLQRLAKELRETWTQAVKEQRPFIVAGDIEIEYPPAPRTERRPPIARHRGPFCFVVDRQEHETGPRVFDAVTGKEIPSILAEYEPRVRLAMADTEISFLAFVVDDAGKIKSYNGHAAIERVFGIVKATHPDDYYQVERDESTRRILLT